MRSFEEQLERRPVDEARLEALAERMRQRVRAYHLREIRAASRATQADVAACLHVSQNRVSRLENGDIAHSQIDTIRRYVEALGGQLRVEAAFGDTRYALV